MNQKTTATSHKIQEFYLVNPLESREERYSEHLEEELCLEHSCPIEYLCFSCCDSVLCSQCLTAAKHTHHDIKNIERSKLFLRSQLQEWTIKLQSHSDRFDVFYNQIRGNSADVYEFANLYKERLSYEFNQLIKKLNQKLEVLKKSIDEFSSDYKQDCYQKQEAIRTRKLQLNKMVTITKDKIERTTIHQQAQYYTEHKATIDRLIDQHEINFYKQQYVEPNWGMDVDSFKNIKAAVDRITVNFKFPEPYRNLFETSDRERERDREKDRESVRKSSKKSRKDIRLPETDKFERAGSKGKYSNINNLNAFIASMTPKNTSKEKKLKPRKTPGDTLLKKRKKSSTKIFSMPASPERQRQTSLKISPCRSPKNFKKKDQH